MISTISVHQAGLMSSSSAASPVPPPQPPHRGMTSQLQSIPTPNHLLFRRQLNLQFLDLTDCASLEDSGVKMVVEACPQLLYLFLRRCANISGKLTRIF